MQTIMMRRKRAKKIIMIHDGWNTIVFFWNGLFSGAFAFSFREGTAGIIKSWPILGVIKQCKSMGKFREISPNKNSAWSLGW